MSDYYFQTEHMTVGYDGRALISDIKIEVNRGEIITLIGPNGAGKSTILKSITKQLKLIAGSACLEGQDIMKMPGRELAQKMAVVLTQKISPELMTCYDVVATGRYPYTGAFGILSKEDHEKVSAAMDLVHASELKEREFSAISDGQRQRVMLARAICQEPEIIILDEPTSFLDIRHKLEFLSILRNMVKEQQMAVIVSLHELDLAQKVSDRIICVKGDQINRYGSPEEVFSDSYIRELYDMGDGYYDSLFGCMELPPVKKNPELFIIAGGGSGIALFRRLQREGRAFAAGVLHENDLDYHLASKLSDWVISEKAFEEISDAQYEKALALMKKCRKVIVSVSSFGPMNRKNQLLVEEAQKMGLHIDFQQKIM